MRCVLPPKRLRTHNAHTTLLQAIKMVAQSQLDGTLEKCAMLVAIDELVKSKKAPDIDTIELYEWACGDFFDFEVEYADTLGPLRARWAKANPASPLALQCLQSCLENWDLVSAQQVCISTRALTVVRVWLLTCIRLLPAWTRPTPTRPIADTCSGTSFSPSFFQYASP